MTGARAPLRRRPVARRDLAAAVLVSLAVLTGLTPAAAAPRSAPEMAPAAAVARSAADAAVLQAHAALAEGDAVRLEAAAPLLEGTALEPYLHYWRASLRLRAADPDEQLVRPFLTRYEGSLLADRLRGEWLLVLAARGDWAGFDAERRRLVWGGDDAQMACWTLLSRYTLDDGTRREAIAREARRTLASTSDPGGDGCTALADRLLDDGRLAIWPRLQALVERKQVAAAQKTVLRLPAPDAAAAARLLERPGPWLAGLQGQLETMPHPLPLLAIVALARESPEQAARYAERIDPALSPEERALVWGRIGREAQLALLPQANDWFDRGGDLLAVGPDYVRPADVLEARARAALRRGAVLAPASAGVADTAPATLAGATPVPAPASPAVAAPIPADGAAAPAERAAAATPASADPAPAPAPQAPAPGPDWAALRRTIAQMGPDQRADPTWVYWNAQALIAQGRVDEGRLALRSIADRFSYYGRLAADQLQLPLTLAPRPEAPAAAQVDALAQRPGFVRARKLFELGLRDEATREWNWELRGMDDAGLHAAAELARRFGVLDRMIASSERTRALVDLDQRYPMPYADLMSSTAAPLGMDPAWIYGLIRQESRFMEDVRSNAGAIGLMQLMPATARFVAHRIGFEHYRADRVAEVGVNLRLGTEYLKLVFDDQDAQPLLASAAYNAGPARVRRWRAALARPLEGAIFVETIPINETRDYVKRVLFNTVVYGALLNRPAPSLVALLGPVTPRGIPAAYLP
jgi:soluble lytic murein transglycosylase